MVGVRFTASIRSAGWGWGVACALSAWLSPRLRHLFILHLKGFIESLCSPQSQGPAVDSICIHISQVLEITSAHKCYYFQQSWCKPYLLPKRSAKNRAARKRQQQQQQQRNRRQLQTAATNQNRPYSSLQVDAKAEEEGSPCCIPHK